MVQAGRSPPQRVQGAEVRPHTAGTTTGRRALRQPAARGRRCATPRRTHRRGEGVPHRLRPDSRSTRCRPRPCASRPGPAGRGPRHAGRPRPPWVPPLPLDQGATPLLSSGRGTATPMVPHSTTAGPCTAAPRASSLSPLLELGQRLGQRAMRTLRRGGAAQLRLLHLQVVELRWRHQGKLPGRRRSGGGHHRGRWCRDRCGTRWRTRWRYTSRRCRLCSSQGGRELRLQLQERRAERRRL